MSEWGVLLEDVYLGGGGGPARGPLQTTLVNELSNPSFETNNAFWNNGPVRTSLASGVPNAGDWVGRFSFGITGAVAPRHSSGPAATTPGEIWTMVLWLRNAVGTRTLRARLRFSDASDVQINLVDTPLGDAVSAPSAGPFVRVAVTGSGLTGTTQVQAGFLTSTGAVSDAVDVAAAMLVRGSTPPTTYWDGSTPDTLLDIYSWNGTPHASSSTYTHLTLFAGESCVPDESGCLLLPPDGLGLPDISGEDVSYPQRDGVRHFDDWYGPRIITLQVAVGPTGCPACPSVRERVQAIMQAWSRKCEDVEMAIFTDCHGTEPDVEFGTGPITGPYGVVGRPRVAALEWLPGRSKSARITLRFDVTDQRMYILNSCGVPGSGEECVVLTPDVSSMCRQYDRCYTDCLGTDGVSGWAYTDSTGATGNGPQDAFVIGTICANPIIATLDGSLTDPVIENLDTGEVIGYSGQILDVDEPVIIDTSTGTATQGGESRTHLLTGNPRFRLEPGSNMLRLTSFNTSDDGSVSVCWRPAVESG